MTADQMRVLLCYCGELELLHRMPRHYFVTPQQEQAAAYDYSSPLPRQVRPFPTVNAHSTHSNQPLLTPPVSGCPQLLSAADPPSDFEFYVGDDLQADFRASRLRSVTLRLRITSV